MAQKQAYESLRLSLLVVEADDIVTASPPFADGGTDDGMDLPFDD